MQFRLLYSLVAWKEAGGILNRFLSFLSTRSNMEELKVYLSKFIRIIIKNPH
jgi:hypothetical protein